MAGRRLIKAYGTVPHTVRPRPGGPGRGRTVWVCFCTPLASVKRRRGPQLSMPSPEGGSGAAELDRRADRLLGAARLDALRAEGDRGQPAGNRAGDAGLGTGGQQDVAAGLSLGTRRELQVVGPAGLPVTLLATARGRLGTRRGRTVLPRRAPLRRRTGRLAAVRTLLGRTARRLRGGLCGHRGVAARGRSATVGRTACGDSRREHRGGSRGERDWPVCSSAPADALGWSWWRPGWTGACPYSARCRRSRRAVRRHQARGPTRPGRHASVNSLTYSIMVLRRCTR